MKNTSITLTLMNIYFFLNTAAATVTHPNKLENELAAVSTVMEKAIDIVVLSWSKPQIDSLESLCNDQLSYLNKAAIPYAVKSASCNDDGIITIEMNSTANLSRFLQNTIWTLTPMYIPDDPTKPPKELLRSDEEYEEGLPITIGISTFRCNFQFAENIQPIDFQFTKPSTEKHLVDVFEVADSIANTARPLSKYCDGVPRAITNNL